MRASCRCFAQFGCNSCRNGPQRFQNAVRHDCCITCHHQYCHGLADGTPDAEYNARSDAGYGEGKLNLRMFLPKNYQEYVNAGQVIADMLRNVGINVDIQIVEWATWLSDIYNGRNYDLTVVGHTGRLDAYSLLSRYRHDAAENYFNYENAEFDSLLDAYVRETDEEKRKEIAFRMEEILAEDVPALYIQDPIQIYVTDSDLEGFRTYPINIFRMDLLEYSYR